MVFGDVLVFLLLVLRLGVIGYCSMLSEIVGCGWMEEGICFVFVSFGGVFVLSLFLCVLLGLILYCFLCWGCEQFLSQILFNILVFASQLSMLRHLSVEAACF